LRINNHGLGLNIGLKDHWPWPRWLGFQSPVISVLRVEIINVIITSITEEAMAITFTCCSHRHTSEAATTLAGVTVQAEAQCQHH